MLESIEVQRPRRGVQIAAHIQSPAQTERRTLAFVLRKQFHGVPERIQPLQRIARRQFLPAAARFAPRNPASRHIHPRFQPAIAEVRHRHPDGHQRQQRRARAQQRPPRHFRAHAFPAGAHGRAVAQDDVAEQVAQKQPLRGAARTHRSAHHGRRVGRRIVQQFLVEKAGRAAPRSGRRRQRRPRRRHRFLHHHRPHAGKIKAAQERVHAQLAGAAQVHQQPHGGVAQLAKLARKLVDCRQLVPIVFARQKRQALVAQRMEEAVERGREAARFLFGVYSAVPGAGQGQRDAQHLVHFLIRQVAHVVGEKSQPVQLAEQHVNRQPDAQHLRDFSQPRIQIARRGRQHLVGAGLEKILRVDAHNHAARRLLPAEQPALGRLQASHQPHPTARLGQQTAAGFHEYRFLRQPDIHRPRGHQIGVLVDLPRQQVRFHARMDEQTGFGRAGFAHQKIDRHVAQAGFLADGRGGQPVLGVAHERFDLPFVCDGGCLRLLRFGLLAALLFLPLPMEQAPQGEYQAHQDHPHHHQGHARQVQQSRDDPGDRQKDHTEDGEDDVVAEISHGPITAAPRRKAGATTTRRSLKKSCRPETTAK